MSDGVEIGGTVSTIEVDRSGERQMIRAIVEEIYAAGKHQSMAAVRVQLFAHLPWAAEVHQDIDLQIYEVLHGAAEDKALYELFPKFTGRPYEDDALVRLPDGDTTSERFAEAMMERLPPEVRSDPDALRTWIECVETLIECTFVLESDLKPLDDGDYAIEARSKVTIAEDGKATRVPRSGAA
jgi:hypothetical protein